MDLKKTHVLVLICLCYTLSVVGQSNLTSSLYETYDKYLEKSLDKRRIKHHEIAPLVASYATNKKFHVQKVGASIEGRDLSLISIGTGDTDVFLWSQMHGDEPTATQAIFDILNFLNSDDFADEKKMILSKLKLHFLPMLNPDGAELFTRRNALGIDINRDALRLQSPEGQTLKRVRDSLNAEFGFNLHDQSRYYNAERTDKPATISYLAPVYNYEKEINDVRGNAMKVIVFMNTILQKYAQGQVGRYNDDFEPRAFGDNITKWGTSAILIESGGYANDREKQEIRKLNYVSILAALYTIADESYKNIDIKEYEKIPENDRKLFDLKLNEVTYQLLDKDYLIDLGIFRNEVDNETHSDFYYSGTINEVGDLSTYYGYETLNAKGFTITEGKVYPTIVASIDELKKLDIFSVLKNGYTYVRVANLPKETKTDVMINILSVNANVPKLNIGVGGRASFLLKGANGIEYAVINGFLINLNAKKAMFGNPLIYR